MAISHLRDICIDCIDPHRVAHFWAAVLGYTIQPADAASPRTNLSPCIPLRAGYVSGVIKCQHQVCKNRVHIDINLPNREEMIRLQRLGARVLQEIHDAAAVYAGQSWPIPRGMSSVPFSPRSTCRHGRTLESEVIMQRVTGVCRAEQVALLQLGHHERHEVVEVAGKQRRGEHEAVAGPSLDPGLAMIGDLRR